MTRMWAFLAVLAVGLPVMSWAYDNTSPTVEKMSPPTVTGVIDQIDFKTGRFVVIAEAEEHVFQSTPATIVTLDGYAASFKELRLGYQAAVQYDSATREALRIDATR